eukprot:631227-Hanusia_phi.AAC.1
MICMLCKGQAHSSKKCGLLEVTIFVKLKSRGMTETAGAARKGLFQGSGKIFTKLEYTQRSGSRLRLVRDLSHWLSPTHRSHTDKLLRMASAEGRSWKNRAHRSERQLPDVLQVMLAQAAASSAKTCQGPQPEAPRRQRRHVLQLLAAAHEY